MSEAPAHWDVSDDQLIHVSPRCHDGNLTTYCMAMSEQEPFLKLEFEVKYVHKVLLINRNTEGDGRDESVISKIIERINGAEVDLLNDGTHVKTCGTISTVTEKQVFWVDCNAVGTAIKISLNRKKYLNLAEVKIYTLGKQLCT